MKLSTTDNLAGFEIAENLGVVQGNCVQSKHLGRDIMANIKSVVGGELKGYTELLLDARRIATERMMENARELGADAIVAIRMSTSSIVVGASEILVYGTAVKIHNLSN